MFNALRNMQWIVHNLFFTDKFNERSQPCFHHLVLLHKGRKVMTAPGNYQRATYSRQ